MLLGLRCSLMLSVLLRLKLFGRMVQVAGAGGVVRCPIRHVTVDCVTCDTVPYPAMELLQTRPPIFTTI